MKVLGKKNIRKAKSENFRARWDESFGIHFIYLIKGLSF